MSIEKIKVCVIGAGTMGAGIAHLAAINGHKVVLIDKFPSVLESALKNYSIYLKKQLEKSKISQDVYDSVINNLSISENINDAKDSEFVIEAIIENLDIKLALFKELEEIVSENTILATNTSSLSIASIAGKSKLPNRIIGVHFFNPATIMQLVEIIPSVLTLEKTTSYCVDLIKSWSKITVLAKDTPGFIVNKVARPYYGEALKIYEEGIADIQTIDWAMKEFGKFRMGPFELMDLIGNDVNYTVTETVFKNFYYDPRYRPSITQLRLVEAGIFGKKTGRGFYNYNNPEELEINKDSGLGDYIFKRILSMLINEACDTFLMGIADSDDIDLAMTKATNYPLGLFEWAELIGHREILDFLESLFYQYGDPRYRPSVILKKLAMDEEELNGQSDE